MVKNDDENTKELLKLGVEELRRLYDSVGQSFEGVRTKALALLAGEVGIITFLFSAEATHPIARPFLISTIALYGIGIFLLILSFVLFLSIVSPVDWHHPPETKDLRDMPKRFNNSPQEFLDYLKCEYAESITGCIRKLGIKSKRFVWAIFILSIGILLISLLKFGSGTINI